MIDPRTPAALGYRMPAEWEPQAAIWLSWPHNRKTWPGAFEPIPAVFAQITRQIAESQDVRINVADVSMAEEVRGLLQQAGVQMRRVHFHFHPTNDCWVRDHGPLYVVRDVDGRRQRAITNWGYNAWGGKYPPYDLDDAVPERIAAESHEPIFSGGMILEGGAIDVNGQGLLMTSESCLLNPNRNPQLSKSEIENRLKDYLGVTEILWLGEGIEGDDTDGHIDDMTRFVGPRTVVTVVEDNPADPNYEPLRQNLDRLQAFRDANGQSLEVVTLPMPGAVTFDEQRLPASYANFLITNQQILVPVFDDPRDQQALECLRGCFPNRDVVGIFCRDLVWGLGAIHCASQQQPLADPANSVDG